MKFFLLSVFLAFSSLTQAFADDVSAVCSVSNGKEISTVPVMKYSEPGTYQTALSLAGDYIYFFEEVVVKRDPIPVIVPNNHYVFRSHSKEGEDIRVGAFGASLLQFYDAKNDVRIDCSLNNQ